MNISELEITKQGFTAFCKAQGDSLVDHSYSVHGAWTNCAVGQYYTDLTDCRLGSSNSLEFVEALELAIDNPTLADDLGEAAIETYADIVKELQAA